MVEPLPPPPHARRRRLSQFHDVWRNFRFALRYSWQASRAQTTAIIAVPLLESLLPAALALVLRGLVNATLRDRSAPGTGRSITEYVTISLVLSIGLAVAQSVRLYLTETHTEALEHRLATQLMAHADTLDFAYFERPDFQDMLVQVRLMPGHHIHEMLAKCVRTVALLITLLTLLGVLATIEPRLLVLLLPVSVPYLWYRLWVAKTRYHVRFDQNRSGRWIDYYTRQMMSADVLPEVRTLDLGPLFLRRVEGRLASIHDENRRSFRLELLGSSAFNSFAVVAIHLALLWAARGAVAGRLSPGDIAVFAGAATGLRSSLDALVAGVGSLRWHLPHLAHLRTYFGLAPSTTRLDRHATTFATLRADNGQDTRERTEWRPPALALREITFTYPGSRTPVLDGLSFSIEAGETVGLVGRNGSGKSTMVKLINGLYVPDHGRLEVAGTEVRLATSTFLHDNVATVFQTVAQHNATARENIAMGDWRVLLDDPRRVWQIARQVGLDDLIRSLPQGYETTLGRTFGDVSISGGQWQTFAIARAFARPTPLIILDEPTASLDPEAEFEVFERFKELASGRATLLISHRFSTLALADRIVVLNHGMAEEQGTHDELLARGGTYAHLHDLFRRRGETGVWK